MSMRVALMLGACCALAGGAGAASEPANPNIDMGGFLATASEAAHARMSRRVSEAEFLRMAREPGTVVLDARSRAKYDELHVAGAVNLSFPDFTAENLAHVIGAKDTRVLIYCNNNFKNALGPFPTKLPSASLNLSTFVALYDYGYRNVYELGPLLDPARSLILFESSPFESDPGGR